MKVTVEDVPLSVLVKLDELGIPRPRHAPAVKPRVKPKSRTAVSQAVWKPEFEGDEPDF